MDNLPKNLRLMDSRIKDCKAHGKCCAAIEVSSKEEADKLMLKLVERGVYDMADSTLMWESNVGYRCIVSVWWE